MRIELMVHALIYHRTCSIQCIIASNTSTLDFVTMSRNTGHLETGSRIAGVHYFSPAHVMNLLEIIKTPVTSSAVLESCLVLAKQLQKTPIVVGNCCGFLWIESFFIIDNKKRLDSLLQLFWLIGDDIPHSVNNNFDNGFNMLKLDWKVELQNLKKLLGNEDQGFDNFRVFSVQCPGFCFVWLSNGTSTFFFATTLLVNLCCFWLVSNKRFEWIGYWSFSNENHASSLWWRKNLQ